MTCVCGKANDPRIRGGNVISSVITMSSIRELGLKVGGTAYAVIKASNVMIGVDD